LGYEGFAGDCIEVVHIKRYMVSLILYNVKEVKEGDDSFRVTMTRILPNSFMLEPTQRTDKGMDQKVLHIFSSTVEG
jgi:hypothetical protein